MTSCSHVKKNSTYSNSSTCQHLTNMYQVRSFHSSIAFSPTKCSKWCPYTERRFLLQAQCVFLPLSLNLQHMQRPAGQLQSIKILKPACKVLYKDRSRAAEYLVRSVTVHVSFALHMAFTCPDTDLGPAQVSIIRLHEVTPEEHLSWSFAECNRTLGCP